VSGHLHASAALPPGERAPWYQLDRRLGGPPSRSGCRAVEENLCPARNLTSVVQSLVHCYTGCAIPSPPLTYIPSQKVIYPTIIILGHFRPRHILTTLLRKVSFNVTRQSIPTCFKLRPSEIPALAFCTHFVVCIRTTCITHLTFLPQLLS
jgi:hypothetical protein